MRKEVRPILVTGSHRSGTTWAGQILALAPHTGYIHEPFNINIQFPTIEKRMSYWFKYICNENESQNKKAIDKVINYSYPFIDNIKKVRNTKQILKVIRDSGIMYLNKMNKNIPIVKDPIAFFSTEWLYETYKMNILVMIRHPAAFCSSLKIKNWRFDFRNFLEQPLLMNRYLSIFDDDIRQFVKKEMDIIDQAILLWKCIHKTVATYNKLHPEWIFMKHEELSRDPLMNFNYIYKKFGLNFTEKVKKGIIKSSCENNPTEQEAGKEFRRNSKENITNWKIRLSSEEICKIKKETNEISSLFYEEYEW
jgi:hypothetical protein